MRKYLYEAKTADGTRKSGYVEAATVAAAREHLTREGLVELVLLDDDMTAALRESEELAGNLPDKDVDLLARYRPQPWRFVALGIRKNWVMNLVFAALIVWVLAESQPLVAVGLGAFAAAVAILPGWVTWRMNEVHRQFWLGNWDASERIARGLRRHWLWRNSSSVRLELDSRIASAMVKKGDLAGAMKLIEPWEGSDRLPQSVIVSKVAGLRFLARDWAGFLDALERVLVITHHADSGKIDLAQALARMGDDDARASALLDEVDMAGKGPLPLAFYAWGRGVIALNRGDNDGALDRLAVAVAHMQEMGANPLMWGAIAAATGYLAIAMARTGRREAAAAMLAPVKAMVQWHGEDRLVEGLRSEGLL